MFLLFSWQLTLHNISASEAHKAAKKLLHFASNFMKTSTQMSCSDSGKDI